MATVAARRRRKPPGPPPPKKVAITPELGGITRTLETDAEMLATKADLSDAAVSEFLRELQTTKGNQYVQQVIALANSFRLIAEEKLEAQAPLLGAMTPAAFENQLNNALYARVGEGLIEKSEADKNSVAPSSECNVTSLSMQLQIVAKSKEATRAAVCDLLEKKYHQTLQPADRSDAQIEDLLLRRFFLPGWADGSKWKEVSEKHEPPFDKHPFNSADWMTWTEPAKTKRYHQVHLCLLYVALEIAPYLQGGTKLEGVPESPNVLDDKYFKDTLRPWLNAGGSVILGTLLTGGHVVTLTHVFDDGLLINDPYGIALRKGHYIKNGMARSRAMQLLMNAENMEFLHIRIRYRPDLVHLFTEEGPPLLPENLGEGIFFEWRHVTQWRIGKWTMRLRKGESGPAPGAAP